MKNKENKKARNAAAAGYVGDYRPLAERQADPDAPGPGDYTPPSEETWVVSQYGGSPWPPVGQ